MTTELLDSLSNFLFIAGGGGVVAFVRWLIERRDRQRRLAYPNVLKATHEVYQILHTIIGETPAGRVLVMRAENGGEVPALGKELSSTVVYEVYGQPFGSKRKSWTKRALDEQYVQILLQTVEAGEQGHEIQAGTLKKSSILADTYESDGVKSAVMYPIAKVPGMFFYLVLNFAEEFDTAYAGAKYREFMRVQQIRLRQLFEKYGPVDWGKA